MLIPQKTAIRQTYDSFYENLNRPTGLYGHDWGHHDWNIFTGGAVGGTTTTLAMRSRHGKTAALVQVIEAASRISNGRRADITFFSWEMSAQANIERQVCHELGCTVMQYRYPKAMGADFESSVLKAFSKSKNFPVHYHQVSANIETVCNLMMSRIKDIRREEVESGIKIIPIMVVDYVSMAQGSNKYSNKTYDIGHFMQTAKQFANLHGVANLFLAQIRRDVEGEPTIAHIQDSSTYEQNSDNVIIGFRPEADMVKEIRDPWTDQVIDSRNKILWKFVKTRSGNPGEVIGNCDMRYFRFWNREHNWGYDYNKLYESDDFWKQTYGLA